MSTGTSYRLHQSLAAFYSTFRMTWRPFGGPSDRLRTILTPILIGWLVQKTGGFAVPLLYVGALPLLGVFLYVFVMGDVKRLEVRTD